MNILITSGGTTEKIDNVRGISNNSTGGLGCAIAEAFATVPNIQHIFYVCSKTAARPKTANTSIHFIENVNNLYTTVENICISNEISVIVHAMAVSDYTVASVALPSDVEKASSSVSLIDAVTAANLQGSGKISSSAENLLLLLKKTPKVIGMLRNLAPEATIFGFKLLDNAPKETLIDVGFKLLVDNACDFVLANDAAEVSHEKHIGYLINKNRKYETFNSKPEIATAIAQAALQQI